MKGENTGDDTVGEIEQVIKEVEDVRKSLNELVEKLDNLCDVSHLKCLLNKIEYIRSADSLEDVPMVVYLENGEMYIREIVISRDPDDYACKNKKGWISIPVHTKIPRNANEDEILNRVKLAVAGNMIKILHDFMHKVVECVENSEQIKSLNTRYADLARWCEQIKRFMAENCEKKKKSLF